MIPLQDENPTSKFPLVTYTIIASNILIFVYQLLAGSGGDVLIYKFGIIPYEITHFQEISRSAEYQTPFPNFLTIFTSMFIHGGLIHVGSNMLYLWIFGDNIEELMGSFRFFIFYLLAGLVGAAAQIIMAPSSTIPMVGASGAISGVLGAYILKFPRARVKVLFFFFFLIQIIRVPAVLVLGFWILLNVLNGLLSISVLDVGGVAWFAHIGGFMAGLIFVNIFQKRRVKISW